jgi:hypothetical protein
MQERPRYSSRQRITLFEHVRHYLPCIIFDLISIRLYSA